MPRGRKKTELKAEEFVNETKPLEVVAEDVKELVVEEKKEEPKVDVVSTGGVKELLVVCKDGTKRLYRESVHGKFWKEMAKQYAKHHHGDIFNVNR